MHTVISQNQEWMDATWAKIEAKLSKVAVRSRDKIPYTAVDGVHDNRTGDQINRWTNGFWGGMMWLMYKATGKEVYQKTAQRSEELMDAALKNYKELHHDVGFMWHILAGANYRITGNKASCVRNLYAASVLASRYDVEGDYIIAWNGGNEAFSIIDCLMNLSLLYWASEEVGDERFKKLAMRHMNMALRDHIREDGSTNHVVVHDREKPGVIEVRMGQGYSPTSCWSRGLAWAVYGSVISYIHTGKAEYLQAAKKTADYFIDHCKNTDYRPLVDFLAPPEPVYYDSTAGVCAACGMLELAKYVSDEESAGYTQAAISLLKACDRYFCDYAQDRDALVTMGSERYPLNAEMEALVVHKPIIYGDFFFVEALLKLRGEDFLIW